MRRNLLALTAVLALSAASPETGAAACTAGIPIANVIESTPTSAFIDHGNGTVTHSLTGLMWKRCAQGLSGAGCATGTATAMTWQAALAASVADATGGYSDWRLPNQKELASIVEYCGWNRSINQTIFPATPVLIFWSSSTSFPNLTSLDAWTVNFTTGSAGLLGKTNNLSVRLVRGGQFFGAFDAQHPTAINAVMDVDASITATKYDPLTDGVLVLRYLFGLTGASLTVGSLGGTATRTDPGVLKSYLDGYHAALDIDGNNISDALTDGLMLVRYMFGLRGPALTAGAIGTGATRNTAMDIENYIQSLVP
jgi:hypothetical protein